MALVSTAHPGGHNSVVKRHGGLLNARTCSSGTILCKNQCVDANSNSNCGTCGNTVGQLPLWHLFEGIRHILIVFLSSASPQRPAPTALARRLRAVPLISPSAAPAASINSWIPPTAARAVTRQVLDNPLSNGLDPITDYRQITVSHKLEVCSRLLRVHLGHLSHRQDQMPDWMCSPRDKRQPQVVWK